METGVNAHQYMQKLINSGVPPEEAAEIVSKTVYHQVEQLECCEKTEDKDTTGSIVDAFNPPAPPETVSPAESNTPQTKVGNMSLKTQPKPKKGAAEQLADQVSEAKQAALLQRTKQEIEEEQLTLFDIAPWGDHMRALPNDYARSALFTVRNKRVPRVALQNEPIYSVGSDVNITYTGVELRAEDDELVWQQVMEYSKRSPFGEPISFTFYELCKDLDWSINGRYYKKAEACLSRLQASAMQFESKRVGRLDSLSLISRFSVLDRGSRNSRCQVIIDKEMVVLFAGDYYSRFMWDKYRKLAPTARRMFDYFATHKEPFPMKLETFRLMCGSESTRPKKWREQVWAACDQLSESGLVGQAWIAGDLLYCKRS